MLGYLTDELDGGHIIKWLATGPKSYYYETDTCKNMLKVKGFTLCHDNARKINGDAMEKLIDGESQYITVQNNNITRNSKTKELVNKVQAKKLSYEFDKRIIVADYYTIPYGYNDDG